MRILAALSVLTAPLALVLGMSLRLPVDRELRERHAESDARLRAVCEVGVVAGVADLKERWVLLKPTRTD